VLSFSSVVPGCNRQRQRLWRASKMLNKVFVRFRVITHCKRLNYKEHIKEARLSISTDISRARAVYTSNGPPSLEPNMDSINCIEDCRCVEGSNSGTSPILGPFSGPWIGTEQWKKAHRSISPILGPFSGPWISVEQWKHIHLGTSTVVHEPGCMTASSRCPLQDDPYDATVIRVGRPWVMPLSEQDLDNIGPMAATKESQSLQQSLRDLANAQGDGSQNVDVSTIFPKMSRARRRIRCKERRIVFKISNVPQPWRAEMYCARRSLG
jgi:hypothetical protein